MTSIKSLKTPLRWPGGKSRAISKLEPHIPDLRNYEEYREPFLGGGSVAIHITKKYPDLKIWVNDLYSPLVIFWQQLQILGDELKSHLLHFKSSFPDPDSARQLFNISKTILNDPNTGDFEKAVRFYIVNKCSFSGLTESSSFSPQASNSNFSIRGIEKLPEYSKLISNWKITNYPYNYLMDGTKSSFVYLDPPYDIKDNLYGNRGSMHKGFDHDKFSFDCNSSNMDILISYNSDQLVKNRFMSEKWNAAEFDLTYTMRSVGEYMREQKQRKELLLFNYEL